MESAQHPAPLGGRLRLQPVILLSQPIFSSCLVFDPTPVTNQKTDKIISISQRYTTQKHALAIRRGKVIRDSWFSNFTDYGLSILTSSFIDYSSLISIRSACAHLWDPLRTCPNNSTPIVSRVSPHVLRQQVVVSVGQICLGDLSRETQAVVSRPLNRLHLLGSRGGGVLVYHHKLE